MKKSRIKFFHSPGNKLELIYCQDSCFSYSLHTHIFNYVLGFILSGSVVLQQHEESKHYRAGDFFVIPPNVVHGFSAPTEGYSLLSVCLSQDIVSAYDLPKLEKLIRLFCFSLREKSIITAESLPTIKKAVHFLYDNLSESDVPKQEIIKQVKLLLEDKPENLWSIKQLAEAVNISPYYLIRMFKQQTGLTPHQFQLQNRIRKARRLLTAGREITETALVTGFYDQSHFSRNFKKLTALTPLEYIKAHEYLI